MKANQVSQEELSLEKAMDKPAALWLQDLNEKEHKTSLKILKNEFKRDIKLKQLKKNFPTLKNLLKAVEKLYEQVVWKQIDKEQRENMHHISTNFGKLTPTLGLSIDRYELAKKAFDKIR
jgi:predicted patatin/cPLA2 family phospholipase